MKPVGIIPTYAGLIDSANLNSSDESNPQFRIDIISWRSQANQQPVVRYNPQDQQRFNPGDRLLNQITDVVFRDADIVWNQIGSGTSISGGSPGGGRGGDFFNNVSIF